VGADGILPPVSSPLSTHSNSMKMDSALSLARYWDMLGTIRGGPQMGYPGGGGHNPSHRSTASPSTWPTITQNASTDRRPTLYQRVWDLTRNWRSSGSHLFGDIAPIGFALPIVIAFIIHAQTFGFFPSPRNGSKHYVCPIDRLSWG